MSIEVRNLTYIYMKGTPFEQKALDNVNLKIEDGEFAAIIGHTGSGKSTLIQHLNGLLKPTSGEVSIKGENIFDKNIKLSDIRKKVGLVFQYPEYQLFEETIELDVAFGPKKLGLDEKEVKERVIRALNTVGLDYEEYKNISPFDLSGGQKRRVAIAGILAMEPEVLILDEPTAGLDPRGRDEILHQIKVFHRQYNMTTILVSHSMEDVAKIADKVYVMAKGKCILNGTTNEIFKHADVLEKVGLAAPQVTYLVKELNKLGIDIPNEIFNVDDAVDEIAKIFNC